MGFTLLEGNFIVTYLNSNYFQYTLYRLGKVWLQNKLINILYRASNLKQDVREKGLHILVDGQKDRQIDSQIDRQIER